MHSWFMLFYRNIFLFILTAVYFERVYFFCKWRVQHNKDTTVAVSHPAGDRTHFQSKERIFCRTPDANPKDS